MSIDQVFPIVKFVRESNLSSFRSDVIAGTTVAILLIPQAMAYALLAGMPPIYGLYASIVPLFIYACFASSRHLSIGPVAISALLILSGVSQIAEPGTSTYISLVITLGLIVGFFQLLLGLLRLGFLAHFISHPVIAGFSSAAAVIIILSQIKDMIGIRLPMSGHLHEVLFDLFTSVSQTNWPTLVTGLIALICLVLGRSWAPKIPAALLVVGLGILISYFLKLDQYGVSIVATVPSGLPHWDFPALNTGDIRRLIPTALTVTIIGIVESISIAKAVAGKHKTYSVDPDQELVALGISKIAGSFFNALPSSGSFSRSAINSESGGKTPISSIVSAVWVLLTLLFLTPLFYYLPRAVLAALIIAAVSTLFQAAEFKRLWTLHKGDFYMMVITFLCTLFLGIETGVYVGVMASLLAVVYRSSKPNLSELGKIPGTTHFRSVSRFHDLEVFPDKMILRFDEKLYFGNASFFKERITQLVKQRNDIGSVILDASAIIGVDSTGIDALKELDDNLEKAGIELHLSGAIGSVRDILFKAGLLKDTDRHHLSIHHALKHIEHLKTNPGDRSQANHLAMQTNLAKQRKRQKKP